MKIIDDYEIVNSLEQTRHSIVYRAIKSNTNDHVVIKVLKTDFPSPAETARLKHEYEYIRKLDLDGVVKILEITDMDGSPAVVMEDFGGVALKDVLTPAITMSLFLDLAIRIASILGKIHQAGISHRDIKPSNIIVNLTSNLLKITDFGILAEFTRKNEEIFNPKIIEGTLTYLSPEQTGRINCEVDYRTDLYSLGVTFYEMLSGTAPFTAHDPMEIIHAHIARQPIALSERRKDIPAAISDIVMKLMSKSPEDRYQNAFGLFYDLTLCREQLKSNGRIEPFKLGCNDISPQLNIPRALFGREIPRTRLFEAFERIRSGSLEIALVSGEPGIGKTTLVSEIYKPVVEHQGYFISGKYERFRKHMPGSAIFQAFQGLAHQILAESEDRIRQWKNRILAEVEPNGKIITDAVSGMEVILGKQPDLPELGIEETRNRFFLVLKKFFRALATRERPLVLFLDDLQWADTVSLDMIRNFALDKTPANILIIGSYRDNEIAAHHPLMLMFDGLRKARLNILELRLDVLSPGDIHRFLCATLNGDPATIEPLARIAHAKTGGNPFFLIQFLKMLHEEKYLTLDLRSGWQWDMNAIAGMQVTDNVVEFMTAKIARLPDNQRALMDICACIGSQFNIETLSAVTGQSMDETITTLDDLVQQRFIHYDADGVYRFVHDRILEAAYSLISPDARSRRHYHIGKQVLKITPPADLSDKLFFITGQLNQAKDLIHERAEKDLLLELNMKAGLKAKDAMAYDTAVDCFNNAIKWLPDRAWRVNYERTFTIHLECMECEYLCRNFETAQRLFREINRNARDKFDRAKASCTMIVLYTNIGKFQDAIDLGIRRLRTFGVRLRSDAGKLDVLPELIRIKFKMRKTGIEEIPGLPMMTNPDKLHTSSLFGAIGTPAYYVNPNLFAVVVIKGINMDLSYGLTHTTPFGLSALATIIGEAVGDYHRAYKIGLMALDLNDQLKEKAFACKVHFLFSFMILHWVKPLADTIEYYRKAYQMGLESGDLLYAGYSVSAMNMTRLFLGDNIDEVMEQHTRFRDFIEGSKDPTIWNQYSHIRQCCLNLKGLTDNLCSLNVPESNYEQELDELRRSGNLLDLFSMLYIKQWIHYLYGCYDEACRIGDEMDTLLNAITGSFFRWGHSAYRCLSLLAAMPGKSAAQKRKMMGIVKKHHQKIKRWASFGSVNIIQQDLFIEAERAAADGRHNDAVEFYHRAVVAAHEHKLVFDEALANERAALYYHSRGLDEIAMGYLAHAYSIYKGWGATRKTDELERLYPVLFKKDTGLIRSQKDAIRSGSPSSLLDLAVVIKTSQAISGEIMIDRLLNKIMKMAVMSAGAQRGFLILDTNGVLTIEASQDQGENRDDAPTMLLSLPLEICGELSQTIVNYVHRSGIDVILGNAAEDSPFATDPYIRQHRCKSVLCMPIMNKGKMSGILYMENNLTTNSFNPERLELLHLISSQAAISLENARLFEQATTDGLTRLFVHRYFQFLLDQEIARAHRHAKSITLIMIDIDNFKGFNDNYGHLTGDEVLRCVARTIKTNIRSEDFAARYGGEEFVVVMPETSSTGASAAAEKIRIAVEALVIPHEGKDLRITVSIGAAVLPEHAADKTMLIRIADEALYSAKHLGKNRVCMAMT